MAPARPIRQLMRAYRAWLTNIHIRQNEVTNLELPNASVCVVEAAVK
jgi:hypothetical protein